MKIFYSITALIAAFLLYTIIVNFSSTASLGIYKENQSIGKIDSPYRIVEFLDYNCEYCRDIYPTIKELQQQRDDILYIPRPIASGNGLNSIKKAAIAYASAAQGKLEQVQEDLYIYEENIDEDYVANFAQKHDLDSEKLLKDINSEETKNLIQKNHDLFSTLNLQGTPTFIINEKIFFIPEQRMPTVEDFNNLLKEASP